MTYAFVLQALLIIGGIFVAAMALTAALAFMTEPELGDLGKEKKPKR